MGHRFKRGAVLGENDDCLAWERLATQMRAAGGIIDNVRLGRGPRGRGLFVERRGASSRIMLPRDLLTPVEAIEMREGKPVVKDGADVTSAAQALFGAFYGTLGFSQRWQRDARRAISGQNQLPGPLQDMILKGNSKGLTRFPAFTEGSVLEWFFNTRSIEADTGRHMMPLLDLVNHDATAQPFGGKEGGVQVEGVFEDEILVRYHTGDAWSVYLRWGFAAPADRAYSLGLEVTEPAGWQINVRAETHPTDHAGDTTIAVQGRRLTVDRMLLIGPDGPDAARVMFRAQVVDFGLANPDELFSLICKINKDWFDRVLTLCKGGAANPGLKTVRMAAKLQLKMLSLASQD